MKPETIDLVRAVEGFDGVPIYATQHEATALQIAHGAVELLVTYPREIFQCLALMGLGALSLYLVSGTEPKPARRRRR